MNTIHESESARFRERRISRHILPVLLGAVMCAASAAAQTNKPTEPVEKLGATAVNVNPGAGEHITIDIMHWSTDADRDHLIAAWSDKADPAALEKALAAVPTLGYVWIASESVGYSLRYAQELPLAGGGERILLATDRRLGVWTRGKIWKAAEHPDGPDYPFTVVELHMTKGGTGEGKMS